MSENPQCDAAADEFGPRLRDLIPPPAADYWDQIDEALQAIEGELSLPSPASGPAGLVAVATPAAAGGTHTIDDARTAADRQVIPLANADRPTSAGERPTVGFAGRLPMVAAAAAVAVAAIGGLMAVGPSVSPTDVSPAHSAGPPPAAGVDSDTGGVEPGSDRGAVGAEDTDGDGEPADGTTSPTANSDRQTGADDGGQAGTDGDGTGDPVGSCDLSTDAGLTTDADITLPVDCSEVDVFLESTVDPAGPVVEPVLDPGRHCYRSDSEAEALTTSIQLVVGDDGRVETRAVDHAGGNGLVSTLVDGTGRFVADREIVVKAREWTTGGGADAGLVAYTIDDDGIQRSGNNGEFEASPVDCAANDRLTAKDHGYQIVTDEELSFAPGASSGTVEGGFVGGEGVVHRIEASAGQTLTATISSLEDNASVGLYTPDGFLILKNEDGAGSRSVILPDDGVYDVLVSGFRGNVAYTLTIEIT